MIVDKTDPEMVCNILDSDIYYNESNGRELLKKILVREGLLRIQSGESARNILISTRVFLGKVDRDTFNKLMESDRWRLRFWRYMLNTFTLLIYLP